MFFCVLMLASTLYGNSNIYNVKDFGAKGDGVTLDTRAINKAINTCGKTGGGIVLFPDGNTFLSGSIHLMSNIEYRIEKGAVILGAPSGIGAYDLPEDNPWNKYQDFGHSYYHNSLLWGENLENISFTGGGQIKGGGLIRKPTEPGDGNKAIAIKTSKNIKFENIHIVQGGWFACILNGCRDVTFYHVTINTFRDGIDLVSCSDVGIVNCMINSVRKVGEKPAAGDDAIALKSDYALGRNIVSENIVVRNCIIYAGCNAIQFGSETVGNFRNILVENCIIEGADKAGIGITSNDGAIISGVIYRNIVMKRVSTPLFVSVSDRLRAPDAKAVGRIENITIGNVVASDCYGCWRDMEFTSTISGMDKSSINNITIRNFKVIYKGGMEKVPLQVVANSRDRNNPQSLGIRPASGFYIRNARNITLEDISIEFEKPDLRAPFVVDNVDGLTLKRISVLTAADTDVELCGVTDANVDDSLKVNKNK